jgi:hypothetical protein
MNKRQSHDHKTPRLEENTCNVQESKNSKAALLSFYITPPQGSRRREVGQLLVWAFAMPCLDDAATLQPGDLKLWIQNGIVSTPGEDNF